MNMRVNVKTDVKKRLYVENDGYYPKDFHDMCNHIIVEYLDAIVHENNLDIVIVRPDYPDIAHRIYHHPFDSEISVDLSQDVRSTTQHFRYV